MKTVYTALALGLTLFSLNLQAQRNKARTIMVKEGAVHKGDGKDVDHKTPLSKSGTTVRGNLAVKSASANRSYKRNPNGSMK